MKGDIAFAGFVLSAEDWQELDPETRAQLISIATEGDSGDAARPARLAEGTGKHEVIDVVQLEMVEPESDLPPIPKYEYFES